MWAGDIGSAHRLLLFPSVLPVSRALPTARVSRRPERGGHYVLDTYKYRLEESRPKAKLQKTFTKRSSQGTGTPIFGGSYDASKKQRRWGHITFKSNTNELRRTYRTYATDSKRNLHGHCTTDKRDHRGQRDRQHGRRHGRS